MTTKAQAISRKKSISCRTKAVFSSETDAQGAAGRMNAKGRRVKPYRCDICGKWHLSKRDKVSVLTDLFSQIEKERKHPQTSA